ncbi:MAG: hypothetical protein WEF99_18535 [Thermoanaerobaculia bacterium]
MTVTSRGLLLGLTLSCWACASGGGSGKPAQRAAGTRASGPGGPGIPSIAHHSTPATAALGGRLLGFALDGMGGGAAVDRVRSLELRGELVEQTPDGEIRAGFVERIVFPDRYRRDLTIASTTLSTLVIPEGAFVLGPQGARRLSPKDRARLEKEVMRKPLALLKTRRDQTFMALGGPDGEIDGKRVEQLIVLSGGDSTTAWLDPATGRIVRTDYSVVGGAAGGEHRSEVRYSDSRRAGDLMYPFVSETFQDGTPGPVVCIQAAVVDGPIDRAAFLAPPEAPAGGGQTKPETGERQ